MSQGDINSTDQVNKCSKFSFEKKIGKGAYGEIFKARYDKEGKEVAIKIFTNQEDKKKAFEREYNILQFCTSPYIVKVLDDFIYQDRYYIVMEYLAGDNLYKTYKKDRFNEIEAYLCVKEISKALNYLHSEHIFHGDIKPENIMLTPKDLKDNELGAVTQFKYSVKLIDFGFAHFFYPGQKFKYTFGSPLYLSPEMMNNDLCDYRIDIWAVGVIYYEIIAGEVPFIDEKGDYYLTRNMIIHFPNYLKYNPNRFLPTTRALINKFLQYADSRIDLIDFINLNDDFIFSELNEDINTCIRNIKNSL